MKADQGISFGLWDDPVSRFLYIDCMSLFLSDIDIKQYKKVADYGGGNGLLKRFIPQSISVDIDEAKCPDIVDDILIHKGDYDLIFIRYVLHYLSEQQISQLFLNLKDYNGQLMLIQFANDGIDLQIKKANSLNEGTKYFRDSTELLSLLNQHLKIDQLKAQTLSITPEFYLNRLGNPYTTDHIETVYFISGKIRSNNAE